MLEKIFESSYEKLKNEALVTRSEIIATKLFEDKVDKSGVPYINHLRYVSNHQKTDEGKAVGLLHDLLEDTKVTEEDLRKIGYAEDIITAVKLLTRNKSKDSYSEYIDKLLASKNDLAIMVKKADLENNMDLNRFSEPSLKDYDRVEKKYKPEYKKLLMYLGEIE